MGCLVRNDSLLERIDRKIKMMEYATEQALAAEERASGLHKFIAELTDELQELEDELASRV